MPTPSWRPCAKPRGEPVYLVGGAVRDLLLGRARADVDLVVEGDAAALAARLGGAGAEHERFGTVKVEVDGHEVDIAAARTETYPRARGAAGGRAGRRASRPTSAAATSRSTRWRSRCAGEPRLIDPYGGEARPRGGLLRVLHAALLRGRPDAGDPRRPLRVPLRLRAGAARPTSCCAGPTSRPSPPTGAGPSWSASRPKRTPARGFGLLAGWGLIDLRDGRGRS